MIAGLESNLSVASARSLPAVGDGQRRILTIRRRVRRPYVAGHRGPALRPRIGSRKLEIGNGFVDWSAIEPQQLSPGVRIRTPYGRNVMLSLVEIDAGCIVDTHSHPHEQAGMLLEGRMRFTIGDESRVLEPGAAYIVPPGVPHRAEAVEGPVRALDVFSPIREDYARRQNDYAGGGPRPSCDR